MKAVVVMFDSLNRRFLEPYGCDWTITPNFKRLADRALTFDNFYVGSMPCMPARRELHTGRYNFLHRSWGPIEPFDDSMPEILADNGIYTHFVSDHAHYWQDGGLTYHSRFSTYEFIRGQEGDQWKGEVVNFERNRDFKRQDKINRKYMADEEQFCHARACKAGIEFLEENKDRDNWYLHLEYFDPHEPFFAPEKYKKMYGIEENGFDWPPYEKVDDKTEEKVELARRNYAALLTMCDNYLGKILDVFDKYNLWEDTMLIVNTDHGYLLGEHGYFAKNIMPVYNELANIPFFIWDPRYRKMGERRKALAQTIDIAPTLLDYFGIEKTDNMQGISLKEVIESDSKIHDAVLFGYFGKHVNVTDGKYTYMRAASTNNNLPLNNYTLMPTHIFTPFNVEELKMADRSLYDGFDFTDHTPVLKIPANHEYAPGNSAYDYNSHLEYGSLLFNIEDDPGQMRPIKDEEIENRMKKKMKRLMKENEAPTEQYQRLGLENI